MFFWTNPRSSRPQCSSCMAPYISSQKLSKEDELYMLSRAGRSKNEHATNVIQWTPWHGSNTVGRTAKLFIHQSCENTGCQIIYVIWQTNSDDQLVWMAKKSQESTYCWYTLKMKKNVFCFAFIKSSLLEYRKFDLSLSKKHFLIFV